jgi:hypothetical protein
MATATAFLDNYVSGADDEEDIVVPTKKTEEDKETTTTTTEAKTTEPKETPTAFLDKYVSEETPVVKEETKSDLLTAIETQPTQEIKAEKGSSVSGAQSLLGGLLGSLQQGAQQKQQEVLQELKQTAQETPTDTEAYKTLEEQTKTYFGQSLQDLSTQPTPSATVATEAAPQPGAPSTKFLDQYIGDISKSIQGGAQSSLSNLLGKPVVASASAPTIYDTFKQNIGNAQSQAIAAAQQAGSSSLANTDKYTTAVNDTKVEQSYFQPSSVTAVSAPASTGKLEAQATSITPVKSNPLPINISQLSTSSQQNLENLTGVTAMKQSIQQSVNAPANDIQRFNSSVADTALADDKTIDKVANVATSAFSSLPKEEREKAATSFLSDFVMQTGGYLNGLTGLGSSVSNVWSNYIKPIGDRLGQGLDQLNVVTGEPATWFTNYLTNSGKDMVTEADVGLPFLFGLDKLLSQPQNKSKIDGLKPGEAVTVYLGGASGGDEYRVAMAMGESAVVYKDQNGNLRITDTKDKDGNPTIKDGKYTGKPGVYMFDRGQGGSYKVDAAGLPGASDVLDAMEQLGIPRKEFAIDIALGASPETIAKQVLTGLSQVLKYAIPALYSAAQAKDALTGGLTEAAKGAQNLLTKILDKMGLPYPFEEGPLEEKEWILSGMWSGGPYYKSTGEVEDMVSWLYGSSSIDSYLAQQALERYPWWKPTLIPGQNRIYSVPVPHRFANPQLRETIMGGGVLSAGPVWFESYLKRNPKLLGIKATNEEQWDKEKVFKATQKVIGGLFQDYLNSINNAGKSVNWGNVMNQIANKGKP